MKLTFLGTSSATPTRKRNVSAMALQFDQRSDWWLFDCGEGTQHQVLRSPLSLHKLRHIFISHMHGDHCFGLMGLLASRSLQGATDAVDLFGPRGIADYINSMRRTTGTHFSYLLDIHECSGPGVVLEEEEYTVRAVEVVHGGQTFAYVIDEKPQPGRFRAEDAKALNIPFGPLYGRLKRGEVVELDDGRTIDGSTLVDPPRAGRKAVIVSDTCDASAVLPFAQGAHLMVHEATYLESQDAQIARDHRHSTAAAAGRLATKVKAQRLAMTHFSPRYDQEDPAFARIKDLVAEAKAAFPTGQVYAAEDFLSIEVPRPAPPAPKR